MCCVDFGWICEFCRCFWSMTGLFSVVSVLGGNFGFGGLSRVDII